VAVFDWFDTLGKVVVPHEGIFLISFAGKDLESNGGVVHANIVYYKFLQLIKSEVLWSDHQRQVAFFEVER
jgi:hypothetical protein